MRVRRAAVPVLLWCLATAASIAVASLALRPVLRTAIPSDTVPLEAADERRGQGGLMTQPQPSAPATAASQSPPAVPPTSARPPSPVASAPPSSRPPATTVPPRVVAGWTVTTGGDGVDTYLRSFRTDGGDAVVRIRAGVVSLVTATPRDGYSASKAQTEPTRLVVQFIASSGSVAWLVDAMWWQDAPHGEVTRIGS